MGQSSNDVIPTAIHVSAALAVRSELHAGARAGCATCCARKEQEVGAIVKTGRTHLMDAMPVTLGQELSGWRTQIENGIARLQSRASRACWRWRRAARPWAPASMRIRNSARASRRAARPDVGCRSAPSRNYFEAMSTQDAAVELPASCKTLAVSLMKIANDLRWMNSGPLAGLGEIALPALQPGSSIMPGKVNPVIPEAATMVAAQVIGNDATITDRRAVRQLPAQRDAAA